MPCVSSGRSSFASPRRQQRLVAHRLDLGLLLVGREPPARLEQARDLEALLAAEHEDDRRDVAGVRELAHGLDQHLLAELVHERHLALARLDERHRHAPRDLDPVAELSGWPTVADRITSCTRGSRPIIDCSQT